MLKERLKEERLNGKRLNLSEKRLNEERLNESLSEMGRKRRHGWVTDMRSE